MQIVYLFMILAGLVIITSGFRLAFHTGSPWNIVGALTLPAGMIVTLLGVLLCVVPDFF